MRRLAPLCASLLLLIAPAAASAQAPTDAATTAQARALFTEGLEHADAERWEEALDRFRRAATLRRATPILFNLALAARHVGALVEASEALREVLRDPEVAPEVEARARSELSGLEPRLGHLTLAVEGPRDGVEVSLDGAPRPPATWGVALPVDPGPHEAFATRDGETVARADVHLEEGEARTLALTVPPEAIAVATPDEAARTVAPAPQPAPEPDGDFELVEQWWFWTLVGVAVVLAVVIPVAVVASDDGGQPPPTCTGIFPCVMEVP